MNDSVTKFGLRIGTAAATVRACQLPVASYRTQKQASGDYNITATVSPLWTSMKLIIQIPCLNEAETLAVALADLPRHVEGFDTVEWLIIDDGSTDRTIDVARENGVDHVVQLPVNRGLAVGFMAGLERCLQLGADVIVNTDADNQYCGADIPKLTAPVLAREADIVIGARPIDTTDHFSWLKKKLQRLGSWAVRVASKTDVVDAPSGFRAISRDAAMRLNVFNAYTYTLETIIQAGQSNLRILSVPVRTNGDLRPSRLVKSIPSYVKRSLLTIFRVFLIYRPLAFFVYCGSIFMLIGLAIGARFLYFYVSGAGEGHIQSVILASLCVTIATLLYMMGLIGDLIATNRKLLERVHLHLRHVSPRANDISRQSSRMEMLSEHTKTMRSASIEQDHSEDTQNHRSSNQPTNG